jgi:sialate O-acetylesterase
MKRFVTALLVTLVCISVHADVKLPAIFGDHMVLQRGIKIPIWGMADPGEKVSVKALQQEQTATADDKGRWRVTLDAIDSKEPITFTVAGKNSITINDVLVGEVWICSGQSNMEFALNRASNQKEALSDADRPTMRLFIVQHNYTDQPQEDVKGGKWMVCTPETAKGFSAVGYFFGVELAQKLNVPIGLIESNWGGTRAEAWTPKDAFDRLHLPYEPAWTEEKMHPVTPPSATRPVAPRPFEQPSSLYNGMIAPIAGYGIRGAIWYQGESNAPHPDEYARLLGAMITSWRQSWGQGDFPFLIVSLANFDANKSNAPSVMDEKAIGGGWPGIRAAQEKVSKELPNSGQALAIDIGNSKDIHPKNKAEVGRRLALVARKVAYGETVEYAGPTFKSLQIDGDKAIVTFDHAEGLKNKGPEVMGFEIAGPDGKFTAANAKIDGEKVIVTNGDVKEPKAVRYAWDDDPKCTLYNSADLPAVPFQTK